MGKRCQQNIDRRTNPDDRRVEYNLDYFLKHHKLERRKGKRRLEKRERRDNWVKMEGTWISICKDMVHI